jgi:hypothetical protein
MIPNPRSSLPSSQEASTIAIYVRAPKTTLPVGSYGLWTDAAGTIRTLFWTLAIFDRWFESYKLLIFLMPRVGLEPTRQSPTAGF